MVLKVGEPGRGALRVGERLEKSMHRAAKTDEEVVDASFRSERASLEVVEILLATNGRFERREEKTCAPDTVTDLTDGQSRGTSMNEGVEDALLAEESQSGTGERTVNKTRLTGIS